MAIADRFSIKALASAGLFGAAMVASPVAAAVPLITGGHACVQGQAGAVPAAAGPVAAAPVAAGPAAGACGAPLTDMSGIPLAVPGPIPAPVVPAAAPLPVVPAGAPLIALGPVPAAPVDGVPVAPVIPMAGGKEHPAGPAPAGGPQPGKPVPPGPPAS